jgi:hypothetical protein
MAYTITSDRLDSPKTEGESITDQELLDMGADIEALIEGGHITDDAAKPAPKPIETAAPVVESTPAISEGAPANG